MLLGVLSSQGKKPKSARDYRQLASRLSRSTLAVEAARVHAKLGGNDKKEEKDYKQWKKEAHSHTDHQKLRTLIFEGGPLAGWLTSSSTAGQNSSQCSHLRFASLAATTTFSTGGDEGNGLL